MFTEGLREKGHHVEVLEPVNYEPLRERLATGRKLRQAWGAWRHLQRILGSSQIDVVEFYGDEFWLATWLISFRKRRPLLVAHTNGLELLASERGAASRPTRSTLRRVRNKFFGMLSWMAFKHSDAFISLCEIDRQYVIDNSLYPRFRTFVVPPGLDAEYVSRSYNFDRKHSVAYLGSWIERKGIKTFVHVMTEVMHNDPNVKLEIFGTLSSDTSLNSKIKHEIILNFPESLRERIMIHSRLNNAELSDALAQAKVFFFPTLYEGYGMALAEAMACGCAVVTTPTGFGGDLVNDRDGLVCDFDDIEGFQACIERLLNDSSFQERISLAGWQRTQDLTWANTVEMLAVKYEEWHLAHIREAKVDYLIS